MRASMPAERQRSGTPVKWCSPEPRSRVKLPSLLHHPAQDSVDPRRVTLAILHEPVVDVLVDSSGYQHFPRSAKLRQLFVGQRSDLRVINVGIASGGLPLRDTGQDGLLRFIHWLAEY